MDKKKKKRLSIIRIVYDTTTYTRTRILLNVKVSQRLLATFSTGISDFRTVVAHYDGLRATSTNSYNWRGTLIRNGPPISNAAVVVVLGDLSMLTMMLLYHEVYIKLRWKNYDNFIFNLKIGCIFILILLIKCIIWYHHHMIWYNT